MGASILFLFSAIWIYVRRQENRKKQCLYQRAYRSWYRKIPHRGPDRLYGVSRNLATSKSLTYVPKNSGISLQMRNGIGSFGRGDFRRVLKDSVNDGTYGRNIFRITVCSCCDPKTGLSAMGGGLEDLFTHFRWGVREMVALSESHPIRRR